MPFNILCFCFISNVFAFLQISLFCCKYVLYLPSYILAFLQMFFFPLNFCTFLQCFCFPANKFTFQKHFCFTSQMFVFLQIFSLSFIYLCFHSKVFEFLPITLLSCKHSYFPLYISGLLIYINFHSYTFFFLQMFLLYSLILVFHKVLNFLLKINMRKEKKRCQSIPSGC